MTRIKLAVYVDLDSVPGAMHSAESAQNYVRQVMLNCFPHYKPTVSIEKYDATQENAGYKDQAIRISLSNSFIIDDSDTRTDLVEGWYLIKSDDPFKKDLVLPPHIFRRCFKFVDEEAANAFRFVQEI